MKYRVEHVRWIPGQGISYNETIGNEDSILTADQLRESYGSYCEDGDWLELIANDTDRVIATTEEKEG